MSSSMCAGKRAALIAQSPPASRLPEVEASKLPINAQRLSDAGPEVLIIHGGVQGGLGGSPVTFARQSPLAEQGWRLTMVERPGFGQSPSRGVDEMEAEAVWIAAMLSDGAHLIGHFWGGATSRGGPLPGARRTRASGAGAHGCAGPGRLGGARAAAAHGRPDDVRLLAGRLRPRLRRSLGPSGGDAPNLEALEHRIVDAFMREADRRRAG